MGATVELVAPDISGYYGNTGVPFVTTLDSGKPGPDAMGASPEHRPHAHCARWQVPRCSLGAPNRRCSLPSQSGPVLRVLSRRSRGRWGKETRGGQFEINSAICRVLAAKEAGSTVHSQFTCS